MKGDKYKNANKNMLIEDAENILEFYEYGKFKGSKLIIN